MTACVDHFDKVSMIEMKSVLGSALLKLTGIGGHAVRFVDVVAGCPAPLEVDRRTAGACARAHVLLGRPVRFVDDDAQRDAQRTPPWRLPHARSGSRKCTSSSSPSAALEPERAHAGERHPGGRHRRRRRLGLLAHPPGAAAPRTPSSARTLHRQRGVHHRRHGVRPPRGARRAPPAPGRLPQTLVPTGAKCRAASSTSRPGT